MSAIPTEWDVPTIIEAMGYDSVELQAFVEGHLTRERYLRRRLVLQAPWRRLRMFDSEVSEFCRGLIEERQNAEGKRFAREFPDYVIARILAGEQPEGFIRRAMAEERRVRGVELDDRLAYWAKALGIRLGSKGAIRRDLRRLAFPAHRGFA